MATYDPAVKAALQQALPGYTVTDDDATWWTNNGGVAAVQKQWASRFQPTVGGFHTVNGAPAPAPSTTAATTSVNAPTGTLVNTRPAGPDVTVSEWQPAPNMEQDARMAALKNSFSSLKTQADLDNFLLRGGYSAEEISKAFPEYAAADLQKEMDRVFNAWRPQNTLDPALQAQVDQFVRPRLNSLMMQGGNVAEMYTNPERAQWAARQLQPNTGPAVLGGYHTTDGQYITPAAPTPAPAPSQAEQLAQQVELMGWKGPLYLGPAPAPQQQPGMFGGFSNPFFGFGNPYAGFGGGFGGYNPYGMNVTQGLFGGGMGGMGNYGGFGGYSPFSSLLQPFGMRGFGNYGYRPMMSNYGGFGGSYPMMGGYNPYYSSFGGLFG